MVPTLTDRFLDAQSDPKAARVLQAGLETFLQFGLRRATMQDIAERAGMSRAALYLLFRNKDDIYAALLTGYFEAAARAVEDTLATTPDPAQALTKAFEAQVGDMGEALMRSPHMDELLSHRDPKTADIMAASRVTLSRVYARWIDVGVIDGRLAPGAVAGNSLRMAQVMLAGFDGLAPLASDWPAYTKARSHLALIYARALTA